MATALVLGLSVLALTACGTRLTTRGNLPDTDRIAEIKPGDSNRDDVAALLGSPSSQAMFDQEVWFYISERTETFAFFEPEVLERKVLIVAFDKDGVVSDIGSRGLEAARNVVPVERRTPTVGNEITLVDQLLGNIGRFNENLEDAITPPSGPPPSP